jgi:pyruvate/2-oxoglutarate/acetoin dehydrogenase E1 component
MSAEIAIRIGSHLLHTLDGLVRRIAARGCFVSCTPEIEQYTLPRVSEVIREVEVLLKY